MIDIECDTIANSVEHTPHVHLCGRNDKNGHISTNGDN